MKVEIPKSNTDDSQVLKAYLYFPKEGLRLTRTPFGVIVELEDCTISGEPAGPGLPSKVIRLALPALTKVKQVSAKTEKTVILNKKPELIAPLQLPQPGEKKERQPEQPTERPSIKRSTLKPREQPFIEPYRAPPILSPRIELYTTEAKSPRPLARYLTTEQAGPVPVVVIEITPVRLTKDGLLEFNPKIEVTVAYEKQQNLSSESLKKRERTSTEDKIYFMRNINSRAQAKRIFENARDQVLNPMDVWDFSDLFPVLITQADYLIITDNQTWDETTATPTGNIGDLVKVFQRLADWKAKKGLTTCVVTVSDIVAGRYGNFTNQARDLQEVIRNFLKWAYTTWGVSWVLLGGDINIIPVRRIAGALCAEINTQTTDPPPDNTSFWANTYLKMKAVGNPWIWWPSPTNTQLLVRPDNGLVIPFDAAGTSGPTQLGWYFCTDNTYNTRSVNPTNFVRVNGPPAAINARLQWLYEWNRIPTDLYYSSLQGPNYSLPGFHDWDLNDNGIYGQHTSNLDLDGVEFEADVSLGRAPVATEAQATAFVDKILAYEQFCKPDGSMLDLNWPSRMLIVSSNWGGRIGIWPTVASPPGDNQYKHQATDNHSLIHLKDIQTDLKWQLIAQVTATDVRLIPYDWDAATNGRGWHYAKSATDLSTSGITFSIFGITFHYPIPTEWVVVYGQTAELTPQQYIFDRTDPDGSMTDQEQLRVQIDNQLPGVKNFSRLYEDEVDLTPAQMAAAPIDHLTEDRLRNALNSGPNFVSLSGHGNSNGCCHLSGYMAQNLNNQFTTFIAYADSCLTNQFEAEDAVSERLLYNPDGGAAAYIGNTRFSWIGVGDDFQRAFFHRLTTTRHLGLLNDTRLSMVNQATGVWQLYYKWVAFALNLMGDPEMPVWTSRPKTLKVSFPQILDKRQPFVVEVRSKRWPFPDLPLSGASVHIQQDSFSRSATTNFNGIVVFDLNHANLGKLSITVTAVDHIPFIGEALINGPAWVSGKVTNINHQHNTPASSYIQLHLENPIDGDEYRGWYAKRNRPDYKIILDAATDAYITEKKIQLLVNNLNEGGIIERFAFGQRFE